MYNSYNDREREVSVDKMLESAEERGRMVRFAKELGVEIRTAWRWRETLSGNRLSEKFMGFSISKTQLDHHLRSNTLVTAKKPTFETEVR
ncbi:hypothetical protein G6F56_000761 [Rhizopus delemar]|nr:hypothetical protein G6F56_000761 [Rhizopus delemar]